MRPNLEPASVVDVAVRAKYLLVRELADRADETVDETNLDRHKEVGGKIVHSRTKINKSPPYLC